MKTVSLECSSGLPVVEVQNTEMGQVMETGKPILIDLP